MNFAVSHNLWPNPKLGKPSELRRGCFLCQKEYYFQGTAKKETHGLLLFLIYNISILNFSLVSRKVMYV